MSLIVVNIYWPLTLFQAQASGIANPGTHNGRASKVTPSEASQAGTLVAWRVKALAKWGTATAQHPDGLPGIARYYWVFVKARYLNFYIAFPN